MIEMVRKNFESYTKKEIEKSKLSCAVQSMIGHPLNKHYKQCVSRNDLNNCLIASDDVKKTPKPLLTISSRFELVEHSKGSKTCE